MNVSTVVEYTDKDKDLLSRELPDNPCSACGPSISMGCMGCANRREYDSLVKKYRDSNIYEIVLLIKEHNTLIRRITDDQSRLKQIEAQIPDFVRKSDTEESGKLRGLFKAGEG